MMPVIYSFYGYYTTITLNSRYVRAEALTNEAGIEIFL